MGLRSNNLGQDLNGLQRSLSGIESVGTAVGLTGGGLAISNMLKGIGLLPGSLNTMGKASVYQHPGNPTHFSIAVEGGKHAHQVVSRQATKIVTMDATNETGLGHGATVVNRAAATARQTELLGVTNLGPYDKVTNSCVSHVCDVLRAGGAPVPPALGSGQLRYLLQLIEQSNSGGG